MTPTSTIRMNVDFPVPAPHRAEIELALMSGLRKLWEDDPIESSIQAIFGFTENGGLRIAFAAMMRHPKIEEPKLEPELRKTNIWAGGHPRLQEGAE